LTPPEDLTDDGLVRALQSGWDLTVASLEYRAVGLGSHHWEVLDVAGGRWFATVDELAARRHVIGEAQGRPFRRLGAALSTAVELRSGGLGFVLAPVLGIDDQPLVHIDSRFAVALYPYLEGQSFAWGDFTMPTHRSCVLDLIVELHAFKLPTGCSVLTDEYEIPYRDELELSLRPDDAARECGPYAAPTSALVAGNRSSIEHLLARYDELVRETLGQVSRRVLTHGEPHPGNTMLTSDGWLLIDWDTVLWAPPERDLWILDPGDGSVARAYREATGVSPLQATLDLYRIRWDLADVAIAVSRFRRQHRGTADDEKTWEVLRSVVSGMPSD
jgi:spectinomycin phosphotransferase/16S rRNA (guanine(1405)-N(7))-methyltransferase